MDRFSLDHRQLHRLLATVDELFARLAEAEADRSRQELVGGVAAEVEALLGPVFEAGLAAVRKQTAAFDQALNDKQVRVTVWLFVHAAARRPQFVRPYALRLLGEPSRLCRWLATRTLALAGSPLEPGPKEAVTAFLTDEDIRLRCEAVRALAPGAAAAGRPAVEELIRAVDARTIGWLVEGPEVARVLPASFYAAVLAVVQFPHTSAAYHELLAAVGRARVRETVPELERLSAVAEPEGRLPAVYALYRVTRRRSVRMRFWREVEEALSAVLALAKSDGWEWKGDDEGESLDETADGRLIEATEDALRHAVNVPAPPDSVLAVACDALTQAPGLLRVVVAKFLGRVRTDSQVVADRLVDALAFGMDEHAMRRTVNTADVIIALYRQSPEAARGVRYWIAQCCTQLEEMEAAVAGPTLRRVLKIDERLRRDMLGL